MNLKFDTEDNIKVTAEPTLLADFIAIDDLSVKQNKVAILKFKTEEELKSAEYELRKVADYLNDKVAYGDADGRARSLRRKVPHYFDESAKAWVLKVYTSPRIKHQPKESIDS